MFTPFRRSVTAIKIRNNMPRIVLGLLFLLPGTVKLLVPYDIVGPSYGVEELFMTNLRETGYLFILLAITQITSGLLLLSNRFVPLALTLLAPIIVNIFLFHAFISPSVRGWTMTLLVLGLELLLVYRHRAMFTPLLKARSVA